MKKKISKKRKTSKFKPYICVEICYLGFSPKIDDKFYSIAEKFGGMGGGSGFGFGKRDISFTFYDLESASKFAIEALKANAETVTSYCELYYR